MSPDTVRLLKATEIYYDALGEAGEALGKGMRKLRALSDPAPAVFEKDPKPPVCGYSSVHAGRCVDRGGVEFCEDCGEPFDNDAVSGEQGGLSRASHVVHLLRSHGLTKESAERYARDRSVLAGRSLVDAVEAGQGWRVLDMIENLVRL